ncbi:MAG: hypothetical protein J1F64_09945, partial [Oscillospiraceae bacterium]|nr:hypothetical protein [Oscillospiraceae bacterium]
PAEKSTQKSNDWRNTKQAPRDADKKNFGDVDAAAAVTQMMLQAAEDAQPSHLHEKRIPPEEMIFYNKF